MLTLADGRSVDLGDRDFHVLCLAGDGRIALMRHQGISLVSMDGLITDLAVPSPVNSVTSVSGGLLAGSADGAIRLALDGTVQTRFGAGLTRVKAFGGGAVALDSTGALFDADGKLLGQMPFSEMVDAVEWKGKLCMLARFPDGRMAVGLVDPATGQWAPQDFPLPATPLFLAQQDGKLYVISPGEVMSVAAPVAMGAPDARAGIEAADGGRDLTGRGAVLRPAEDAVDVVLPPPRLGPWASPAYAVRVGNGGWEAAAPGARVRVPRLAWGKSAITVRATLAGLESTATFTVARERPWWARWPAFLLYAAALAAAAWGAIRWRTARLMRRAHELERTVAERTAELKQAQQAREEFFSTLSHEIRNPLNGVVGLCDILDEAPEGAVAARERMLVRTLKGCAGQLRSMLDDVLDFSRIDRGEVQLNEENFELGAAVDGAARAVDAGLAHCTLELPAEPLWLRGDCGKFRQVITNLVSNALKYGVPPAARVTGAAVTDKEGRVRVRVAVFNTGTTVPPAELTRIFAGFARGEDALRRRIPGSGLGLAVSRRMAVAMGGSLAAFSQDGLTEFRLEAVLAASEAPPETAAAAVTPKVSRALAIEDEPYNRLVLGHILGQLGYEVDWAADGASALERVHSGAYDLVLTDFLLPDINGAELARRILAEVAEPKPPVVAVTAYSTPDKIAEARAAGISGFVTKPVSRRKLEAAILGLGAQFQSRRSLDVARSKVACDFSPLLRLADGRRVLAEYAEALPEAWAETVAALAGEKDRAAQAVHAFRSRLLAVHAESAAEQLALLEDAVRAEEKEAADRLVDLLSAMVADVAEAARARALAGI